MGTESLVGVENATYFVFSAFNLVGKHEGRIEVLNGNSSVIYIQNKQQ